jgi:hypothetical protein
MEQKEIIVQAKQLEEFYCKTYTVLAEMRAIIIQQNKLLINYKNCYNALVLEKEKKISSTKKIHS